jgi:nicotinate-nucleotide adenylyltransferase
MRIGIFGGTFDPIHTGHLILARDALESLDLQRVIFVPNHRSPHKETYAASPAELRNAMVGAALEGEAGFVRDDTEVRRGGSSYAIETVLHLRELHPEADFFYFIGEDNLEQLHTWRRIDELHYLVQFVVLARGEGGTAHPYITLQQRRIDISSTEIRQRVAKGESIRYLVPDKVHAMILEHQLYREVSPS